MSALSEARKLKIMIFVALTVLNRFTIKGKQIMEETVMPQKRCGVP